MARPGRLREHAQLGPNNRKPAESLTILSEQNSLAVDYHRAVLGVGVVVHHVAHPPPELEEGVGEGVRVARPLRVVEQDHLTDHTVLQSDT